MKITIQINSKENGGVKVKLDIDPPMPEASIEWTLAQKFTSHVFRRLPMLLKDSLMDCNGKKGRG